MIYDLCREVVGKYRRLKIEMLTFNVYREGLKYLTPPPRENH